MKPAAFEYERPASVEEAVAALARHGDQAKILAGGQSLIPMMNLRLVRAKRLIDVGRVDSLRRIDVAGTELCIGALTTHNAILTSSIVVESCPLIVEAYREVAHHSVRNRGTLGGSLCHNDPAAEMPLIMSVLGAVLVAQSAKGQRLISVSDFFQGDFTTTLRPDELLVEVRVPIPARRHGYAFLKMAQRKGDFALVACAATMTLREDRYREVRIGYRNSGATTVRLPAVEAVVEGAAPNRNLFAEAANVAAENAQPPSDIHATAEYRRELVRVLTQRVLARAAERVKSA